MDGITVTILENGTVRIETDGISGPNHANAEAALQFITKEIGGEVTRIHRHPGGHVHVHEHEHEHQ